MSTALQTFEFTGAPVRVVLDEQDEPWFVAADVAAVLGHAEAKDLTRSLDEDEKGRRLVPTPGGTQELNVITEGGLFRAIVQRQTGRMVDARRRGQVKAFQRWVTHEVLPSIRRTGTYTAPAAAPAPQFRLPQTFAEALRELASTVEERDEARGALAVAAPKAEAWETVTTAAGADYSVADAAQALNNSGWPVGRQRLFGKMQQYGWITRTDGHWRPYQRVQDQGLLTSRLRPPFRNPATGELHAAAPQVRVTAKGIEKLLELYQQETGQLPVSPSSPELTQGGGGW